MTEAGEADAFSETRMSSQAAERGAGGELTELALGLVREPQVVLLQEGDELLRGVALSSLTDDLATLDVQGSIE